MKRHEIRFKMAVVWADQWKITKKVKKLNVKNFIKNLSINATFVTKKLKILNKTIGIVTQIEILTETKETVSDALRFI